MFVSKALWLLACAPGFFRSLKDSSPCSSAVWLVRHFYSRDKESRAQTLLSPSDALAVERDTTRQPPHPPTPHLYAGAWARRCRSWPSGRRCTTAASAGPVSSSALPPSCSRQTHPFRRGRVQAQKGRAACEAGMQHGQPR
eukprot:2651041-Pleurochrysis_carterae.AAC.1